MITYQSTRGQAEELDFEHVVLAGLATDGGLYVPKTLPHFSADDLKSMANLSYTELAHRVISPFTQGALSDAELRTLLEESYADFRHAAVAPLKQLDNNQWVMELFHGPTLAFKDFALQCLGRLMDFILTKRGEHAVVLGATSGDTGSAAIAGCRDRASMDIFILFPDGRVSDVQRRQMTTITDENVHCVALDGTFDDCQNIVKQLFIDAKFKSDQRLIAVNSINWARILVQIVYYFHATLSLGAPEKSASFSVPTGNFGDIYAGYLAKKMGLPIDKLIIASNQNNILTRCVEKASYEMNGVEASLSPSMDIEISSNFERLLFDIHGKDGTAINALMTDLKTTGTFTLSSTAHAKLNAEFMAHSTDDAGTLATIKRIYDTTGEVLDPHTAVGVAAALALAEQVDGNIVTLATAHPAKFPDAVKKACGIAPELPPHLTHILDADERMTKQPNSAEAIKAFIVKENH